MNLYAFWKYDLPPFLLGGIVELINEDGYVKIKDRYDGMRFKPAVLLPLEKGLALQQKLDEAQTVYEKETKAAKEKLLDVVNGIKQQNITG